MTRGRWASGLIPAAFFLLFMLLLCWLGGVLGGVRFWQGIWTDPVDAILEIPVEEGADGEIPLTRVVIDAGHGGEDGGASSAAGLVEKDVNLSIALLLRELFEAAGVPTVLTRTEDKLLYDRGVNYHGRKKVLDLAARRQIAEATPESLLLSIHMNAFPAPQYSGMQVWYGVGDSRSQAIATSIQAGANQLMPDNHRKVKAADSSIYLLDRLETPAVLVECGFLSSPEEAGRLGDSAYQRALAQAIFVSIMPHIGV